MEPIGTSHMFRMKDKKEEESVSHVSSKLNSTCDKKRSVAHPAYFELGQKVYIGGFTATITFRLNEDDADPKYEVQYPVSPMPSKCEQGNSMISPNFNKIQDTD